MPPRPSTAEVIEAAREKRRLEVERDGLIAAIRSARRSSDDTATDFDERLSEVQERIDVLNELIDAGYPRSGLSAPPWAAWGSPRVVPYTQQPERIYGLGSFEGALDAATRHRRKTVCAGRRYPFQWLRVNPCIEQPVDPADAPIIRSSDGASKMFHDSIDFAGRGVERVMVLCLDVKNRPNAVALAGQGGRASALIEPAVVFQPPILSNSSHFVLAHNHPSNDPMPSDEDIEMARRLAKGARLVGLTMLDFIVLTDDPARYYSLLDSGLLGTF